MSYIDDVIIYAETFEKFKEVLGKILERIRKAGLRLKPAKCSFAMQELPLLGFVVDKTGVKPNPKKIIAVKDARTPRTVKQVQRFLGLANFYRKFVPDYAKIARPLYDLLRKDTPFTWGEAQQSAFDMLKDKLTSAPVLIHFRHGDPTEVRVDACEYGVGGVLLQQRDGEWRPVAFTSRSLHNAELNYTISEKEALAAVHALTTFRPLIWGQRVTVVTDHHALCWLRKIKDPNGRLARWALKLEEFDYQIKYKSGKLHADADFLSRDPLPAAAADVADNAELPTFALLVEEWAAEQLKDPAIVKLKQLILNPDIGSIAERKQAKNFEIRADVVYRKNAQTRGLPYLIVVPNQLIPEILAQHHDDPIAGHLGFARTYDKIANRYFWFYMRKDIKKYVRTCHSCQTRKGTRNQKPAGELISLSVGQPFARIGTDLIGPLPRSKSGKNGSR